MIQEVKMFTVICDNCKVDNGIDDEFSCWNDPENAKDRAMSNDWYGEGGKHYCTKCASIDNDDILVIDTTRFKDK